MKMISELNEFDHNIQGQYIVSNMSKGVNASGTPYLNIDLKDASGTISGKKWEIRPGDEEMFSIGNVLLISGDVVKYKESLQFKIIEARPLEESEIDINRFVAKPPVEEKELRNRFDTYVSSIKNKDCKALLDYFINKYQNKIYVYPAAVSIHHEYKCGFLMHVTTMANIAEHLCSIYPDIDRDILITGILLHDVGKMLELEGPLVFKYSTEGKLLGHISIMVGELRIASQELGLTSEVPLLLEHMVLSHHGEAEFGSPIPPLTKEALLLSLIDNLDSKMVLLQKSLDSIEPGEFTSKIFALNNRSYYKPKK